MPIGQLRGVSRRNSPWCGDTAGLPFWVNIAIEVQLCAENYEFGFLDTVHIALIILLSKQQFVILKNAKCAVRGVVESGH